MLGMAQPGWVNGRWIEARSGKIARQVVQPVASPFARGRWRKVHQAPPDKLAQSILSRHLFHLPYGPRRSGEVEVGRKDGEQGPEPLQLRGEKFVAQAEGGFHQLQALSDISQSFDIIGNAQIRLLTQD